MSTSSAVNRLGGPAVIALVIVAMVAVTAAKVWESTHTSRATIWFTDGTGLFVGDPVKMRGVTIGTVEAVEATPAKVRVEVSYDDSAYVDSEARAAIVAPTLVSGRYVQFVNPVKRSPAGALEDDAVVEVGRTAVPVGYDEIKKQVTDLAHQLGPSTGDEKGRSADSSTPRPVRSTPAAAHSGSRSMRSPTR